MPRRQSIPRPTVFTNHQGKKYLRVRFPIGKGKYETRYYGVISAGAHQKAAEDIQAWVKREATIKPRSGLTVNEIVLAYLKHAKEYYPPRPGRKKSGQLARIVIALKFLSKHAGEVQADEFGPVALREVREKMVESGKCRSYVNYLVSIILRAFRWAVSYQLIPVDVHIRLATLEHLKKGRSKATEGPGKTQAIPMEHIEVAIPYLPEAVAGMVMLQLLAGMRPGEVLQVRAGDITKDGPVVEVDGVPIRLWKYKPICFKGDHLEDTSVQETVMLGARCQAILAPLLELASGPEAFLFPSDRYRSRQAAKFKEIMGGKVAARPTKPYTIEGYRLACIRACKAAGVPRWTPKRLRHTRATELRRLFKDADAAQAVLRHRHISTTERYAHLQLERAAEVMARVG